jgi:hypothetical protein
MEFEVGSVVKDIMSGNHGIILEYLPYEYDENDLDDSMADEYKVFWIDDEEVSYILESYIVKVA